MIEKLARYLCECDEVNPDATLSGDGVNFLWESYAVRVKALLNIMREPTEEMMVAGAKELPDGTEYVWHAMIDEALK